MRFRVVKTRILRKLLLDIGFEEELGRDHLFYFYRHSGKIVVRTKVSHGADEIRQPILGLIGKQLRLERGEFECFLRGETSAQEYEGILHREGVV